MQIRPTSELERAVDAITEFGCPICGEAAKIEAVRYVDAFELAPCEHLVTPRDAIDMERFYRRLGTKEPEAID